MTAATVVELRRHGGAAVESAGRGPVAGTVRVVIDGVTLEATTRDRIVHWSDGWARVHTLGLERRHYPAAATYGHTDYLLPAALVAAALEVSR